MYIHYTNTYSIYISSLILIPKMYWLIQNKNQPYLLPSQTKIIGLKNNIVHVFHGAFVGLSMDWISYFCFETLHIDINLLDPYNYIYFDIAVQLCST